MFQPSQGKPASRSLGVALTLCCLLSGAVICPGEEVGSRDLRGEFGSDLAILAGFYTWPAAGESNHYIDMWGNGSLRSFLASQGLTNNRTLFVITHGKGITNNGVNPYAYYPDQRVWSHKTVPYFSVADLAWVVGPGAVPAIHNVVVAACNLEGAFDSAEVRRHFPNATNVTHAPGGNNGYELVYRHSLIHPSSGVRLLYDSASRLKAGASTASACARQLGFAPYIAQLYVPGATRPYTTQVAGRELLDPAFQAAKADSEKLLSHSAEQLAAAVALKRPDDLVRWPSRPDMTLGRTHRATYIDSHADHRRDSSGVAPQSP